MRPEAPVGGGDGGIDDPVRVPVTMMTVPAVRLVVVVVSVFHDPPPEREREGADSRCPFLSVACTPRRLV